MIHEEVAVILGRKSHFGTNIPCCDSWQVNPVFVSDSQNERMNTIFFTFHDKLGKDQGIIWEHAKFSRPVLASGDIRGMKFNLASFFNKSRSSAQRLYIRAMCKLSLSITANDLIVPPCLDKLGLLFFTAHNFDALEKHSQMYRTRQLHHGLI